MKKSLFFLILLLTSVYLNAQQTSYYGNASKHENIFDAAMLNATQMVVVGSRSNQVNDALSSAFISVRNISTGAEVWSREMDQTANSEQFRKVKIDLAGNIIAMGVANQVGSFASCNGLIARFNPSSALLWCKRYNIRPNGMSDPLNTTHGTLFSDFDFDANNIYVCGSSDFAPNFARSFVSSYSITNGNTNWTTEINLSATTDVYTCIDLDNNNLYLAGFRYEPANASFDDVVVSCFNTTGIHVWSRNIDFSAPDYLNTNRTDNQPLQIFVNGGNYLISGQVGDQFNAPGSLTTFVMNGTIANIPSLFTSNVVSYRSSASGISHENFNKILPSNAALNSFYMLQTPSNTLLGDPTNFTISTIADSRISLIQNMTTTTFSRRFINQGQQVTNSLVAGGQGLIIVGSSLNSLFPIGASTVKDGYIVNTPTTIPLNSASECGVVNDNIIVTQVTSSITSPFFTTASVTDTTITDTLVNTSVFVNVNACIPCEGNDLSASVKIRVLLGGAYTSNGNMSTALLGNGAVSPVPPASCNTTAPLSTTRYLPYIEPYSTTYSTPITAPIGSNYFTGFVFGLPPNQAISQPNMSMVGGNWVDWITVELRAANNPAIVVATKRVMLRNTASGPNVFDNLQSSVSNIVRFDNIPPCNYYVSVKHRNHLGVQTDNVYSTSPTSPPFIDFTIDGVGAVPLFTIATAPNLPYKRYLTATGATTYYRALIPGDVNKDRKVIFDINNVDSDTRFISDLMAGISGYSIITPGGCTSTTPLFFYSNSDVNHDRKVTYNGLNNDRIKVQESLYGTGVSPLYGTLPNTTIMLEHTSN